MSRSVESPLRQPMSARVAIAPSPTLATLSIIAIVVGSLGILASVLIAMRAMMPEASVTMDPIAKAVQGDAVLQHCKWFCIIGSVVAAAITLLAGADGLRRRPAARLWLRFSAWAYISLWAIAMVVWLGHGFTVINEAIVRNAKLISQSYAAGFSAWRSDDTLALLAGPLLLSTILTWAWSGSVLLALRRARWDGNIHWATAAAAAAASGAEERGPDVVFEADRREPLPSQGTESAAATHQTGATLPYQSRRRSAEVRDAEPLLVGPRTARFIYVACIGLGLLYSVSGTWSASQLWGEHRLLARTYARIGGPGTNVIDLPIPLLAECVVAMASLGVLTGAILALRGVRGGRFVVLAALAAWVLADTTNFCLVGIPASLRFRGAANAGTLAAIVVRGRSSALPLLATTGAFLRSQALAGACFVSLRRRYSR